MASQCSVSNDDSAIKLRVNIPLPIGSRRQWHSVDRSIWNIRRGHSAMTGPQIKTRKTTSHINLWKLHDIINELREIIRLPFYLSSLSQLRPIHSGTRHMQFDAWHDWTKTTQYCTTHAKTTTQFDRNFSRCQLESQWYFNWLHCWLIFWHENFSWAPPSPPVVFSMGLVCFHEICSFDRLKGWNSMLIIDFVVCVVLLNDFDVCLVNNDRRWRQGAVPEFSVTAQQPIDCLNIPWRLTPREIPPKSFASRSTESEIEQSTPFVFVPAGRRGRRWSESN